MRRSLAARIAKLEWKVLGGPGHECIDLYLTKTRVHCTSTALALYTSTTYSPVPTSTEGGGRVVRATRPGPTAFSCQTPGFLTAARAIL